MQVQKGKSIPECEGTVFADCPVFCKQALTFDQRLGCYRTVKRIPGPGQFSRLGTDILPAPVQDSKADVTPELPDDCFSVELYSPNLMEILQFKKHHRTYKQIFSVQQKANCFSEKPCLSGVQEHHTVGIEQHYRYKASLDVRPIQ